MSIIILRITFFIVTVFLINSCALSVPKDYSGLREYSFVIESSEVGGGNARCYADFGNGQAYTAGELQANGIKPAFKYSYITDGGSYSRSLEIMQFGMGDPDSSSLNERQFDEIRSGSDIVRILNFINTYWLPSGKILISSPLNDEKKNSVITFSTNGGTKLGFMKIEPYELRPAAGSPANILVRIKMQL